jgi:hypothetical protein
MVPQALMLVTKSGDAAHLPVIEKLLDNKTVITRATDGNKSVTFELQVRDTALAATVLLSKQELKSFFDGAQQQAQPSDFQQVFFNPRLIGFASDETRAAAFEKWSKHLAAQTKDGPKLNAVPEE